MGRVALVTGGSRGIGESICRMLKQEGYPVVANYGGTDEKAQAFSEDSGIPVYKFDVDCLSACEEAVARIEEEVGPIEVLVNNAGITRDGTMHKMSYEPSYNVVRTNLGSCFYVSRCVINGMRERDFGPIVNIGSMNGQAGQYGQVNYPVAKSGIHGFTKALA
ncbi:MAG: acetoacetyl-CoA reductase [Halieaceae bacterium]|jgi:acetoacetyl-CoA reductase